jgi:hypothetical protein
MLDDPQDQSVSGGSSTTRYIVLGVAILYVIVSLYFIFDMRGRVSKLEAAGKAAAAENAQLLKRLGITEASLKTAADTQAVLADKLGMTQKDVATRTRDDLEYLKHRGDRNIFEFSLSKGAKPTPISTVSLQLKKVDGKKGKFTLNVMADDRTIEKKDRTVFEPLQFYTGRERMLFEVVVLTADKNKITGYLSTPKSAPAPSAQ